MFNKIGSVINWIGGFFSGSSSDQPAQPGSSPNASAATNSGGSPGSGFYGSYDGNPGNDVGARNRDEDKSDFDTEEILYLPPFEVRSDRYTLTDSSEHYEFDPSTSFCYDYTVQDVVEEIRVIQDNYIKSLYCNPPADVLKLLSSTKAGRDLIALIRSGKITILSGNSQELRDPPFGARTQGRSLSPRVMVMLIGENTYGIFVDEDSIRGNISLTSLCSGQAEAILTVMLNEYAAYVLSDNSEYKLSSASERQCMELDWQRSVDQDYGINIGRDIYDQWKDYARSKYSTYNNSSDLTITKSKGQLLKLPRDVKIWSF
ncbi:MAG: hypothetical protein JXR56_03050 [Candidatus Cloacimonetes bacterium]|nr:hypothetical protein [Candidatus Cloacimonadota bacterium]